MILQVDFQAGKPVYLQLADQIRIAAASGGLRPGEPLPSLRPLAEELCINRKKTSLYLLILTCVVWIGSSILQSPALGAAETLTDLPAKVRERLEKHAITLSESHIETTIFNNGLKSGTVVTQKWDFDGSRFYRRQETPDIDDHGKQGVRIDEWSFDGQVLFLAAPDRNGTGTDLASVLTRIQVSDTTDPMRQDRLIESQYLIDAGFYFPSTINQIYESASLGSLVLNYISTSESTTIEDIDGKLRITVVVPDPLVLDVQNRSAAKVRKQMEGDKKMFADDRRVYPVNINNYIKNMERMQKMVPKRRVVFLLDPELDYSVVKREEWTYDGKLIDSVAPTGWKSYQEQGLWLPKRCVTSYFTYPGDFSVFTNTPCFTLASELVNIEFQRRANVPFTLDQHPTYMKPGTWITERSSAEAQKRPNHKVEYVISNDGQKMVRSGGRVFQETPSKVNVKMVASLVLIVLLPCVFLLVRARKTKP